MSKSTRPKTLPTNLPLIVSAMRSRVKTEVVMPGPTERILRQYVRWASRAGEISEDEAMSLTLDLALNEFLKKDRNWARAQMNGGKDEPLSDSQSSGPAPAAVNGGNPQTAPTVLPPRPAPTAAAPSGLSVASSIPRSGV